MKSHETFALLADSERCVVIRTLLERDGPTSITALAEHIAARHEETSTEQAKLGLLHNHLPKLEAANAVEHRNDTVVLTGVGAELAPLLDIADDLDEAVTEPLLAS